MPDRRAGLLVRFCMQPGGHPTHSGHNEFNGLDDAEISVMEATVYRVMGKQSCDHWPCGTRLLWLGPCPPNCLEPGLACSGRDRCFLGGWSQIQGSGHGVFCVRLCCFWIFFNSFSSMMVRLKWMSISVTTSTFSPFKSVGWYTHCSTAFIAAAASSG